MRSNLPQAKVVFLLRLSMLCQPHQAPPLATPGKPPDYFQGLPGKARRAEPGGAAGYRPRVQFAYSKPRLSP